MRTWLAVLCVVATAVPPGRADDPEPPAPKDVDLKALQGTWKVMSATSNGRPDRDVTQITITFGKNKLTVQAPKQQAKESTFTLDAKKSPKQIDITHDGRTDAGIYKIEKGELHLCMSEGGNKVRPKGFDDKNALRIVLKKAKK